MNEIRKRNLKLEKLVFGTARCAGTTLRLRPTDIERYIKRSVSAFYTCYICTNRRETKGRWCIATTAALVSTNRGQRLGHSPSVLHTTLDPLFDLHRGMPAGLPQGGGIRGPTDGLLSRLFDTSRNPEQQKKNRKIKFVSV